MKRTTDIRSIAKWGIKQLRLVGVNGSGYSPNPQPANHRRAELERKIDAREKRVIADWPLSNYPVAQHRPGQWGGGWGVRTGYVTIENKGSLAEVPLGGWEGGFSHPPGGSGLPKSPK